MPTLYQKGDEMFKILNISVLVKTNCFRFFQF